MKPIDEPPTALPARFNRTAAFLGERGFAALRRARVAVMGLGGVGSHAASALTRAGVGRLLLVDFDVISETDLNRHAVATWEDVGEPKVRVMRRHLLAIYPEARIEIAEAFFHVETAADLLGEPPDFVVDAIDSLNPKVALLRYCVEQGLPTVSSMGASARSDPSMLRVGPVETSSGCPLAKAVRKRLRRQGVQGGFTAVYSTEPPRETLPPDDEEISYPRGRRRRRLPSLSTMPGIFGYAAASVAIQALSGG